ncbi:MAG: LCP family protein [Actinomycetota bacterium]|nr:LCP family protein [Actinomycetota bacterium]
MEEFSKVKKILLLLFAILLVLAVCGYAYVKYVESRLHKDGELARAQKVMSEPLPNEPINILLLGSDSSQGEKARADAIIFLRLDPPRKKAILISIPRDMRVKVPGRGRGKINAAYAYGGPKLMILTVEDFTGFSIHHFVGVDFEGFKKMVDALGGVDIYVDEPIIDESRKYTMHIPAGYQKFDGETALNYVRYRHGDPKGDLGRIERQQKFLEAFMNKALRLKHALKIPTLVNIFADNSRTDLTISEMIQFATFLKSLEKKDVEVVTLPGTPKTIKRVSYVIPDEEKIEEILYHVREGLSLKEFKEKSAGSSQKNIGIKILNGCGVSSLAEKVRDKLVSKGFRIVEVGNADNFNYEHTVIYCGPGQYQKALVVKEHFKQAKIVSKSKSSVPTIRQADCIVIIIGKDYVH